MPTQVSYPGVYVEEISSGVRTITGIATSMTAFIGRTRRGPVGEPVTLNSYGDFERVCGPLWEESSLGFAIRDFFLNGGGQALIVRLFHPRFADDGAYNEALDAANQVATAATTEAKTSGATTGTVAQKARATADAFTTEPKKTAATIVAARIEQSAATSPSGGTVSDFALAQANKSDNVAEPRKTAAKLVSDEAKSVAGSPGKTPRQIAEASRTAAKNLTSAVQEVATAAEGAAALAGADKDAVKTAVDTKAGTFPTDPQKAAVALSVQAASDAVAVPGATAQSVAAAARRVADAMGGAAGQVAGAAETAADRIELAAHVATAAVQIAAPLTKARLSVKGLELEAATEGSWGNDLRARIDHFVKDTKDPTLFNLTVRVGSAGDTEVHRNVSVAPNHPRHIAKVLQNESSLLRFRGATLATPRPDKHSDPTDGTNPFDDKNTTCHTAVSEQSSDGQPLDVDDFTGSGKEAAKEGLYALERADLFNLLCIPPYKSDGDVDTTLVSQAGAYCEKRRAMLLVDPPSGWTTKNAAITGITAGVGTTSKNAACFFPRLRQPNPLRGGQVEDFVPCGAVAGVMARTDAQRGVWKAPAGLDAVLVGVPELSVSLSDPENGELNPLGINCLRTRVPAGRVIWGARTLQGDDRFASEWKYIPVRRTALFLEESLYRGTQWVVFEPNDEPLWAQIRLNLGAFMQNLFRQGAFQGKSPREAYFVKCDRETTTQNDINLGIVNIVVGFAPLKPAEFVIIKFQQIAGQIAT